MRKLNECMEREANNKGIEYNEWMNVSDGFNFTMETSHDMILDAARYLEPRTWTKKKDKAKKTTTTTKKKSFKRNELNWCI